MAAVASGTIQVQWFLSLAAGNRVTKDALRNALFSAFSPTTGRARLSLNAEPNPNITIAAAPCGGLARQEIRCTMRLDIGAGVESIDLMRDTIAALGRSGVTNARNAAIETLWTTGNAPPTGNGPASVECAVDVSRGFFRITRVTPPRVVTPARPAQPAVPATQHTSARPAIPAVPAVVERVVVPPVPVPITERNGARVVEATEAAAVGTVQSAASVSAITDTGIALATSAGIPPWLLGVGLGLALVAIILGVQAVFSGKKG